VRARPDDEPEPAALAKRAHEVRLASLGTSPWTLVSASGESVLAKLRAGATDLKLVCGPAQLGIKTSLNAAFIITD